jgi:hypothetical protein
MQQYCLSSFLFFPSGIYLKMILWTGLVNLFVLKKKSECFLLAIKQNIPCFPCRLKWLSLKIKTLSWTNFSYTFPL